MAVTRSDTAAGSMTGYFPDIDAGMVLVSWLGTADEAREYYHKSLDEIEAEAEHRAAIQPAPPCYVYVASDHARRAVKVGIAKDPKQRIKGLQTGSPVDIHMHLVFRAETVAKARTVERGAHKRLAAHRLAGEWFAVTPAEAREAIQLFAGHAQIKLS